MLMEKNWMQQKVKKKIMKKRMRMKEIFKKR